MQMLQKSLETIEILVSEAQKDFGPFRVSEAPAGWVCTKFPKSRYGSAVRDSEDVVSNVHMLGSLYDGSG